MAIKNIAFFQVLKIPAFRNLWLSQVISQIFLQLLFFSLIIRVYQITGSNSAVSILVLLVTIPNIFVGAIAGVLVDYWGRKPVMFFCHFLRALVVLMVFLSGESPGWLYSLVFLISVITQFFFPAEAGTIYQVVKDRKLLLTANSLFSVTFFASTIIGNVLAGPFLLLIGPHWTFAIVALAFLTASFFTSRLPGAAWWVLKSTGENLNLNKVFADLMFGLDHLYKSPNVRRGIYLLGISQISIGILGVIAPGFADKVLKLKVADVSLLVMAPAAFGMVIGAFILGQFFRHAKRESLIRVGFLSAAILMTTYAMVDKISAITPFPLVFTSIIFLAFMGLSNAFLDIPVNTMIQENTSEEVRSRVYGVVSSVIGIAGIVPIILSGALADVIGVRIVMLLAGVILLFLAVRYNTKTHVSNPS